MENNNGFMMLKNDLANFTKDYDDVGRGLAILNPTFDKFLNAINDEQSIIGDVEMYSDILQTIAKNKTSKHENESNASKIALSEAIKKLDSISSVLDECKSEIANIPEQLSDYVQRFKVIMDAHSSNIHSAINLSRPFLSDFVDTNSNLVDMVPKDHALDGAIKVDSVEPVAQNENEVKADSESDIKNELDELFKNKVPRNQSNIADLTEAAAANANIVSDSIPTTNVEYAPISIDDLDFKSKPSEVESNDNPINDNANDEFDIETLLGKSESNSKNDDSSKDIDNDYIRVDGVEDYDKVISSDKSDPNAVDNGYSRVLKN